MKSEARARPTLLTFRRPRRGSRVRESSFRILVLKMALSLRGESWPTRLTAFEKQLDQISISGRARAREPMDERLKRVCYLRRRVTKLTKRLFSGISS